MKAVKQSLTRASLPLVLVHAAIITFIVIQVVSLPAMR